MALLRKIISWCGDVAHSGQWEECKVTIWVTIHNHEIVPFILLYSDLGFRVGYNF